jgi:hypothetical protein
MNSKDLRESGRGLIEVYLGDFMEGMRKPIKKLVESDGVPTEIRSEHLWNTAV